MARAFRKLRCKLVEMDIQQKELADWLRVSPSTISTRLSGHLPWSVPEAVQVAEILGIPLDQLSVFFYDDGPESLAARKKALCRAT